MPNGLRKSRMLTVGVAAYFGADALNLHPATYLNGLLVAIMHTLTISVKKAGI
jgi:hypothetical protein